MTKTTSYQINNNAHASVIDRDILYVEDLIDWGDELIELAEEIDKWKDSVEWVNGEIRLTEKRTSDQLMILSSLDEKLFPFEAGLFNAYSTGLNLYKTHNSYMTMQSDEGYSLLRYKEGHFYGEHADYGPNTNTTTRLLSAVIYLNDDYVGGELLFTRQDIRLRPQAGSLVMFPSIGTHPHEATPVTKGTKYAVVTWMK